MHFCMKTNQLPGKLLEHLYNHKITLSHHSITVSSVCLCSVISLSINTPRSNGGSQVSKGFGRFRRLTCFDKVANGAELIPILFNELLCLNEKLDFKFRVWRLPISE